MEGHCEIPFEGRREPFAKRAVGVEAGHLVLVLVRHQLVGVAGDGAGKRFAAAERAFGLADPFDEIAIPCRPRRVLPRGEVRCPPPDELVQGLRCGRLQPLVALERQALHRFEVARGPPAPPERLAVHLHRDPVELDGPFDGGTGDRDEPLLVCESEEEEVARDRVSEEPGRDAGGIQKLDVLGPRRRVNPSHDGVGRELQIRVAGELPCDLLVGVDDDPRVFRVHHVQCEVTGGDEAVAAEHEVRGARVQTDGAHVLGTRRDPHMARDRSSLLGHSELVHRRERDALEMGGHGDQRSDGDDPGAAHPRDENAEGATAVEARTVRLGQSGEPGGGLDTRPAPARLRALYGHEARTEAFDTGEVLVAGGLVDAALASVLGVEREHRETVRLRVAVAAALADPVVDERPAIRVHHCPALSPPALLRRTGLVVD